MSREDDLQAQIDELRRLVLGLRRDVIGQTDELRRDVVDLQQAQEQVTEERLDFIRVVQRLNERLDASGKVATAVGHHLLDHGGRDAARLIEMAEVLETRLKTWAAINAERRFRPTKRREPDSRRSG